MASGVRETTSPQLEIYLEKPWGGVASNASVVDILDNQFVAGQGVIDVDSVLCAVSLVAPSSEFKFIPHTANAYPTVIFNLNGNLFALDQFGNMYKYGATLGIGNPTAFTFLISASDAPWVTFGAAVVQVVDGNAYIAIPDNHAIYIFNGSGLFTPASTYTGGNVIGVLDDYLLQMNTNDSIDGLKPTRVNWSVPGAFSVWDPGVNRSAGFNTLANVEDAITGFISLASVGIIIGKKELVEVSPTGVGIKPFTFTVLWSSEVGQGILYPNTVSQYGQNTYAGTDTGVFKISTAGFQEVSGMARTAILQPVQGAPIQVPAETNVNPAFFAGNILLYAYNSSYPTPHYAFVESTPITGPNETTTIILWLLNLESGIWFNTTVPLDTLVNTQNGVNLTGAIIKNLKVFSAETLGWFNEPSNNLPTLLVYGGAYYPATGAIEPFIATIFVYTATNIVSGLFTPAPLNIVSKAFDLKMGREPTVRRIIVKAYGTGTLTLSINQSSFGTIQLDGSNQLKNYYTQQGQYTGEMPQLTITSPNFTGCIVKVLMAGTYADGDID